MVSCIALSASPARVVVRRDPRLTVVVLSHRRPFELRRTLRRLVALPERPSIIVVDNGSDRSLMDMVREQFPDVTLLRSATNLGACARNIGVRHARTPYVAFCDDDTWWEPGSLCLAADWLDKHTHIGAMTARVLVGVERREDTTSTIMRRSPLDTFSRQPGPTILGMLAGATVFRRAAFIAAGGYHPRFFLGGEEALLALDMAARGWTLVYSDQLTVHHYPSLVRDVATRRATLARNEVWTAWLRLPLGAALRQTWRLAPRVWREAGGIAGWGHTLRGLPWTLRERRVIPPRVEAMRRRVEAEERLAAMTKASGARQRR
ncbi:glycosyl transferase [Pandoraea faecigallinarum]|uniref:Glycosyl transferase n=1 Tax=Pandoraea faecigallinarum TaxID=656179 RepID=A0A0H3WXD8_9BURK|nr:glycosyltransferase [Pandoraea faecigallinarum]AKM32300.1 glycosyl transferase [Pandoraea faecigallinarum]